MNPKVVSSERWLAARQQLRDREIELFQARDAVSEARRALPAVLVKKDYVFVGPGGEARLVDEIIGTDPQRLRGYYGELFGWEFDTSGPVSPAVSGAGNYGFTDNNTTSDGVGIPGGAGPIPMVPNSCTSISGSTTSASTPPNAPFSSSEQPDSARLAPGTPSVSSSDISAADRSGAGMILGGFGPRAVRIIQDALTAAHLPSLSQPAW